MSEVKIEKDEVVRFLVEYLDIEGVKGKLSDLKKIDWNPFNEDGDEYVGVFAEIKHNWDLVWSALVALCHAAERLVIGGAGLTNVQKHEAVVAALDKAIILPWYMEPFDSIALGMLVAFAVKHLNSIDWGIDGLDSDPIAIVSDGGTFKEIG